jgi:Fanconi anemia group M protein
MPFLDIFSKKEKMNKEKMKIVVDYREKNSLVIANLINLGVEIDFQNLPVADYLVEDIAIERKTISDFISSMINKRLLRQLEGMGQFRKKILIIEGYDEKDIYDSGIHENAIRGMIFSVILNFEVPIIFTKNAEDTARYLLVILKRIEKGPKEMSFQAKKKASSPREQQQIIMESFPGIGPSIARELLKKFESIEGVINAEVDEMKEIKRLGEKKAKIIKDLVERKYI